MDPQVPEPSASFPDDTTLGGYFAIHQRPPAFLGSDGHPYSVSIETEHTSDLRSPYEGYLVFVRWNAEGLGVIGHLESATLWTGRSKAEVESAARSMPVIAVQEQLEAAIARARAD